MNDIIRNIEAAQLKAEVPEFRVGEMCIRDSSGTGPYDGRGQASYPHDRTGKSIPF